MKKFIIGLIIAIIVIVLGGLAVYNFSFKPQVEVTSVNSPTSLTEWNLTKKFLPKDIDLSLSQISATSDTNFSNRELTDLFISVINKDPKLLEYVTGLQVNIQNNNLIDFYLDLKYKGIPLQAHLVFKCMSANGKGIFHYVSGKVGFIDISKDTLFNYLSDNNVFQFDSKEGDIILSFPSIKNLNVLTMSSSENNLKIQFKATLKFWDWLKTENN